MARFALEDRTVLVTGASSGIGHATALAFAKAGCHLVLAARRQDRLLALAEQVRTSTDRRVRAIPCDVTSTQDVRALFHELTRNGEELDVVVNNAGLGLYGPLEAISEAQLSQVMDVNVMGAFRVIRAAIPLLKRRRSGQIINVSSVLGHRGLPFLGGYAASKAALNAMTEALRLELRDHGIDVLLVSPGLTATEFRETRLHAEGYQQEPIPLKAMSAEEVAEAIVSASRSRRRETVLTLPGRVMVLANRYAPTVFDRVADRFVGKPGDDEAGETEKKP
jgi:short-subunit dehydrogenase